MKDPRALIPVADQRVHGFAITTNAGRGGDRGRNGQTCAAVAGAGGAVAGTLPDLDVFIDHGDAIRNMTLHRTESHALLWLTLVAPLLLAGGWRDAQPAALARRCLAIWLALITHPLLDLTTVYGTQLGLPLTDYPFAIGSMFIIDPLYTLPLLFALIVALWRRDACGLRWNQAGLLISTLYRAGAWWRKVLLPDILSTS